MVFDGPPASLPIGRIEPHGLGLLGGIGVLVAGARRADFPSRTEMLLLRVATNQAAMGLHEAHRLNEQRRSKEYI